MTDRTKEMITKVIQSSQGTNGEIIRQRLFDKTEEAMTIVAIHGFMNVWFAAYNMPLPRIVNQVFRDQPEKEHITKLLEMSNYDFFSFIGRLDEMNRGKVIKWILTNYNGVNYESIENRYITK